MRGRAKSEIEISTSSPSPLLRTGIQKRGKIMNIKVQNQSTNINTEPAMQK
jgi:hypothetical protein